jgi:hypothetical protein
MMAQAYDLIISDFAQAGVLTVARQSPFLHHIAG